MTKEESIKIMQKHLEHWERMMKEGIFANDETNEGNNTIEAFRASIEALQTESCEELDFVQPHKKIPVTLDATDTNVGSMEPCEDAVSRKDIDNYITCLLSGYLSGYLYDDERERLEVFSAWIWNLPPVTPKQRTGKWISRRKFFPMAGRIETWEECSECHTERPYKTKYCPDCGSYNGGEYAD